MKPRQAVQLVALLAALLLLVALIARIGPRTIAQQTAAAGVGAVWLLVAYAAGTALGALPWYVVLPVDARPGIRATLESRFAASGANAILPLFGLGGEPLRLLWMRPGDRATGIAAIVVDRLVYVVASAVFLAGAALAALGLTTMPSRYALGAALGALALLAIALVAMWLVARHRIAGRIDRMIRRWRPGDLPDDADFAPAIDRAIARILARRDRIVAALALSVVARVVLGAEIYAGFHALGVALSPELALVLAGVPVVLAFAGAIVPSQIGLQEGSLALAASMTGLLPATAVAVVLLQRIRQIVTGVIAWVLVARRTGDPAAASLGSSPCTRPTGSPNTAARVR